MRDRNTFAKRQQELRKKQKAHDKRARRQKKKDLSAGTNPPENADREADGSQPEQNAP